MDGRDWLWFYTGLLKLSSVIILGVEIINLNVIGFSAASDTEGRADSDCIGEACLSITVLGLSTSSVDSPVMRAIR